MSGGSMNYLYSKVEDAAHELAARAYRMESGDLRAFAAWMKSELAPCLRAVEWETSGDGDDKCYEMARRLMGRGFALEYATEQAERARADLDEAIRRAKEGKA